MGRVSLIGLDRRRLRRWLAVFLHRSVKCQFSKKDKQKVVKVLDTFLANNGEKLIRDPLLRALFLHDLWTMFDATSNDAKLYPLQKRIARIMKRVALSRTIRTVGSIAERMID